MMTANRKSCSQCDSKSGCFKNLSPVELELADMRRAELHYRKGEHIAKQGSYMNHILYLQRGLVKVYMETESDTDLILNIFSNGSLIGLSGLFGSSPLPFSVAAIEDSIVCAIDKKTIEDLVRNNGEFARSIIESINACTYYHYKRLITASQKQLSGRMADALMHLADQVFHSGEFAMTLSRKELAELAGMSMMSAVRTIKDLEQSGIISEDNGTLCIKDRQKLENLSRYG